MGNVFAGSHRIRATGASHTLRINPQDVGVVRVLLARAGRKGHSEGIVDFLRRVASDPAASPEQIEAEFFAKIRPSSRLQRMIEPKEIANLVAYLASSLSSATNGAALRVDGGLTPTIGG